jgi:hypothetical protein
MVVNSGAVAWQTRRVAPKVGSAEVGRAFGSLRDRALILRPHDKESSGL